MVFTVRGGLKRFAKARSKTAQLFQKVFKRSCGDSVLEWLCKAAGHAYTTGPGLCLCQIGTIKPWPEENRETPAFSLAGGAVRHRRGLKPYTWFQEEEKKKSAERAGFLMCVCVLIISSLFWHTCLYSKEQLWHGSSAALHHFKVKKKKHGVQPQLEITNKQ